MTTEPRNKDTGSVGLDLQWLADKSPPTPTQCQWRSRSAHFGSQVKYP